MKALAIDYGTKRIGLARSYGTLAEPWQILHWPAFSGIKEICEHISQLIEEEKITDVVVGISENEMAQKTYLFIEDLKKYVSVPIHTFDETLSSQAAAAKLHARGKRLDKREHLDHFAAAEFLQEWLDEL